MALSHWEWPLTSTARSTEINQGGQSRAGPHLQALLPAWLGHDGISSQGYQVFVLLPSQPGESDPRAQPNQLGSRGRMPRAWV